MSQPVFRRIRAVLAVVLCTGVAACALTAPALADPTTGGATMPQQVEPTNGGTGYGDPGMRSLVVHPIAILGEPLVARGTMPGAARRMVVLQLLDGKRGWRNVARSRIRSTARFAVSWRTSRSGPLTLRAIVARERRGRLERAAARQAPATAAVKVYRSALATYYGPGFFGNQTACGQTMTPDLLGVAHKRLPCGTRVAVTYASREIVVPVVDRGPFNEPYSWDLTQATADALGFTASGTIGYMRIKD